MYITKRKLTKEIKETVAKTHNLITNNIIINWIMPWQISKLPGGIFKVGKIKLHAPKFKTQTFCIYQKANHSWYMR